MEAQALLKSRTLPQRQNRGLGFTLIELLVTITITGILAAAALPAYSSFVASQRIKTASFELISTLSLARSEALKQNTNVVIAPASGGWRNGWTTIAGGTTLNEQTALRGVTFISNPAGSITYTNSGRLLSTVTSFELSSVSNNQLHRCISIDLSGRPNSKVGAC